MAPTRNPPDLFKFLEEVFSCGPEDKRVRIRNAIPTIQQNRTDTVLKVVELERQNKRRGEKTGTFKTKEEARVLENYREMNNPPKRASRPAQNFNREKAPQSSPIFWVLKYSEYFINLFTAKNLKNETPGLLPREPNETPSPWPKYDSDETTSLLPQKLNEIPSSSPQPSGNVESFLSSIFCCSPRRK